MHGNPYLTQMQPYTCTLFDLHPHFLYFIASCSSLKDCHPYWFTTFLMVQ